MKSIDDDSTNPDVATVRKSCEEASPYQGIGARPFHARIGRCSRRHRLQNSINANASRCRRWRLALLEYLVR
jgi:hypothetical protein